MKDKLLAVLEVFGPEGENWSRGLKKECIVSACSLASGYRNDPSPDTSAVFHGLIDAIQLHIPLPYSSIVHFNDDTARTFADVESLLGRAIEAA